MSTSDSHPTTPTWYEDAWRESASQVLEGVAGEPFAAEPLAQGEARTAIERLVGVGAWARFSIGNPLAGEHVCVVSQADGLRLAQTLRAEPLDDKATFDEGHKDAFAELLRQIAGAAATALAAKLGSEIEVKFVGAEPPAWTSSHDTGFRLSGQRTGPLSFYVRFSSELAAALASRTTAARPEPPASNRPPGGAGNGKTNVDLLREVELGVTLRFGERQVLLRDILELVPGAVIELDQQVDDPVELLVGKKVIARGEVVVVDGNYGLRVTEIVSAAERMESLRT